MPGSEPKIVSQNFEHPSACNLEDYQRGGGYRMARRATTMSPEEIHAEVSAAKLRERAGAGLPTALKWGSVPRDADPVYLVLGTHESGPEAFKDSRVLRCDPHLVLEGMMIAARALGVRRAYVRVGGWMGRAYLALEAAVEQAYAAGLLGERIGGTDEHLDITVSRGMGAYLCGDETALLASLEGGRGVPRVQVQPPGVRGLWGKPTVVSNVETVANLPWILEHGGDAFANLGLGRSGGLRVFSVCGHVNNPGVFELPMRVTGAELIELCGGVRGGRGVKGVMPGGVSAPLLRADELDVPLEFDALQNDTRIQEVERAPGVKLDLGGGRTLRSLAGTGGVVVMDDMTDMTQVAARMLRTFARVSCGQRTPCREGTGWLAAVAQRVAQGHGRGGDVDLMASIAAGMASTANCPLADAAAGSTLALLTKFRDEFRARVGSGASSTGVS